MRTDNNILVDLLELKIKNNCKVIEMIENSFNEENEDFFVCECKIKDKEEENKFLREFVEVLPKVDDGIKYLKKCIVEYKKSSEYCYWEISKASILKQLIKEYKAEYKKNSKYINKLGIDGMFDNDMFCSIIKRKIVRYTSCNKVTSKKYRHLTAFLNEFLVEMQMAKDPLKTLNDKLKLYEKYKNSELVEVYNEKKSKVSIIREVLKEYNERVYKDKRCR